MEEAWVWSPEVRLQGHILNHTPECLLTGSSSLNWAEISLSLASSILFPLPGANWGSLIFPHEIVHPSLPSTTSSQIPPKLPYMTWFCLSSPTGHSSLNANTWQRYHKESLRTHLPLKYVLERKHWCTCQIKLWHKDTIGNTEKGRDRESPFLEILTLLLSSYPDTWMLESLNLGLHARL